MKLNEIYRCDRVEGLVIDATCGGVIMYSRIVKLTDGEIGKFREARRMDNLACRIACGDEEVLAEELLSEKGEVPNMLSFNR